MCKSEIRGHRVSARNGRLGGAEAMFDGGPRTHDAYAHGDATLLGASRQRVNQELKSMEREQAIRIEPGGLVIRNRQALMRICELGH